MRWQQDTLGALLSASYRGWTRAVNCHCHWIYTEPWDKMQHCVLPSWVSPNKHESSAPLHTPLATCWHLPLPFQGQNREREREKDRRKRERIGMRICAEVQWALKRKEFYDAVFFTRNWLTPRFKLLSTSVSVSIGAGEPVACVSDLSSSFYCGEAETLPRPPYTFIKHPRHFTHHTLHS